MTLTQQAPVFFVVTGNDLLSGDVVYLTKNGQASTALSEANWWSERGPAEGAAQHASKQADKWVGVYVACVTADCATHQPVSLKEQIRAAGPTITPLLNG